MVLDDSSQRPDEELSLRILKQAEPVVRRFISELLAEAVKERANRLQLDGGSAEGQDVRNEKSLVTVLDGVRLLDQAESLSAVLNTLAALIGAQAPRVAVLTVDNGRVRGWHAVGFGMGLSSAREIDNACADVGIVGQAVDSGKSCSAVCGPDGMVADVAPGFSSVPTGALALAVPVVVGCEVKAVVYADDAGQGAASQWRAVVEILARYAGHCLEALTTAWLDRFIEVYVAKNIADQMSSDVTTSTRRNLWESN